jgi:hypothetical protein
VIICFIEKVFVSLQQIKTNGYVEYRQIQSGDGRQESETQEADKRSA